MTFNLSERLEDAHPYVLEQVKEFVRLLKELASDCLWTNNSKAVSKTVFFNELDKLAGDELI